MYKRAHTVNTIEAQTAAQQQSVRNEAFRTKLASWYGMYKQAEEEKAKKVRLRQSDALKRSLTDIGTGLGGVALGGTLGYLAGDTLSTAPVARLGGMALGALLGGGAGLYGGDRIAVANKWIPEELATKPGRLAATLGGGTALAVPGAIFAGPVGALAGSVAGTALSQYLYKKFTGTKDPTIEIVDE